MNNDIYEMLRHRYPGLSEKEFAICEWAYYTMWDLHSGNSAMYEEVVLRLFPFHRVFLICDQKIVKDPSIFRNEEEIVETISNLVSKGVLNDKYEIWTFGGREENTRVLSFVRQDLYGELNSAWAIRGSDK